MKKVVLNNGLTVIFEHRNTDTVGVEVCVNAGSNNEPQNLSGVSHFIEHLVFEGTKHRTAFQISNDIEGLGGEIGAFTSNERTCFYVKSLPKHFSKSLDVLADIIQNPTFSQKSIEKERKVVLSEISMMHDQPRFYQWELFQKTLFKKHPARIPIIGTEKTVKAMTRKDIVKYHSRFYVANNIVLSIVGNVKNPIAIVKKKFSGLKQKELPAGHLEIEPPMESPVEAVEKRQIEQSYLVLGYKTVPRTHRDSYTLDVIRALLGKGLSGRLFTEIRTKRGLGYDVGVHHEVNAGYGFFAVYVSTEKNNVELCKSIILREFNKLSKLTKCELNDAKNFLEGEFLIENEDNQRLADTLAFWENAGNVYLVNSYLKNIRRVTAKDVAGVVKRYFTKNYALAVVSQS